MSKPILEVDTVGVRFGGIIALNGVSFNMQEGHIVGLIGPNGAGKTTLFNCLSRLYVPNEGDIRFRGETILNSPPHHIAELGIGRTFQNLALFQTMSVLENVMVGGHSTTKSSYFENFLPLPWVKREEDELRERAAELLNYLGLSGVAHEPVGGLPFGTQKRVELARALVAEPKLLLLDEPMAGMNVEEKEDMSRFILDVNDEFGTTIALIEHDMGVVMDLSDRVVVMDYGKKIGDGTPDEVRSNQEVIDAYLGVSHD